MLQVDPILIISYYKLFIFVVNLKPIWDGPLVQISSMQSSYTLLEMLISNRKKVKNITL